MPRGPHQNRMIERGIQTPQEQGAHRHRIETQQSAPRVTREWSRFCTPGDPTKHSA